MGMYKIVGADGRPYGPISAEQLRQWIAEGRANAQTQTFMEGTAEWKPLGTLTEFANHFAPSVPPVIGLPAPGPAVIGQRPRTNSFATTGMVFGILSLLCCFKLLFGALGLIFSLIALVQINENPQLYQGRGMAITGLVLSVVGILLAIALLILGLAMGHYHMMWNFRRF
jgi:Domain of unknown function (DUF4190)/GYF domain 2